jgi:hypothetical protein
MLTETLSGKCPCCGYNKLLQRYGSFGYLQLDGCANCGFGYASNHHDDDEFGLSAWLSYAKHILSLQHIEPETDEFYERSMLELNKLPDDDVRRMVFDWCEKQERVDDVDTTVFVYSDEDIQKHKNFGLQILNLDIK